MATYSVMLPPDIGDRADGLDRIAFVPDGFSRLALVLGPFWLAWTRLWLALSAYVLLATLLAGTVLNAHLTPMAALLVVVSTHVFLGFEGRGMKLAKFLRRNYLEADVVTGACADEVERRFFVRWPKPDLESR